LYSKPKDTLNENKESDVSSKNTLTFNLRNLLKKYLKNSAFVRFVLDRVNTNKTAVRILSYIGLKPPLSGFDNLDVNLMPALKKYPEIISDCWEDTKAEFLQLKNMSDDMGIRLVIAVIPTVQSVEEKSFKHAISHSIYNEEDFELDKPYQLLDKFAQDHDMEMIIPVNLFRTMHNNGKMLYLKRDMHFSAAGHDLFARVIADYLIEKGVPLP
jgi:hypothetical protein